MEELDGGGTGVKVEISSYVLKVLTREKAIAEELKAGNAKHYMNIHTGSVDVRSGWDYENEDGEMVNAVDLGECVEVVKDENGDWVKAER